MPKRSVIAVTFGILLGSLVGAGLAIGGTATQSKSAVLHVVEHATTDTTVSVEKSGDHTGDLLTFHNQLFDAADHRQVGTDLGHCVRIVPGESYDCTWTAFLRGGEITVYGPFYDSRDSELAITGGTGIYSRARGSMKLHSLAGGTKYDFIYRLS